MKDLDLQFEVCDPKFTSIGIHVEPSHCTNFTETVILHRCTLLACFGHLHSASRHTNSQSHAHMLVLATFSTIPPDETSTTSLSQCQC